MKRKILGLTLFLVLLCAGGYFFRYELLVFGAKQALPKQVSYRSMTAQEERIYLEGVLLKTDEMDLMFEKASFGFDFLEVFRHPMQLVSLLKGELDQWQDLLLPIKQYGLDLRIDSGVLALKQQQYVFSFTPGEQTHEIGTLSLQNRKASGGDPFLVMKFHMRGDELISQLHVEEGEAEDFFHLAAFALPQYFSGFADAKGTIGIQASVIFREDGCIDEVATRVQADHFAVSFPKEELFLSTKHLRTELNYPEGVTSSELPIWKRMSSTLQLEQGIIRYKDQFSLSQLEGSASLDTREAPSLLFTGELAGQEEPLILSLTGKGAVHEDHAYWLEFDLGLDDRKGTDCHAFLSICRPEDASLVVQVEATGLLPGQVEMLKNSFSQSMPRLREWSVLEGSFGGRLVALFEGGNLSHFEVRDLVGSEVVISSGEEPLYLASVQGEGRLFSELNFSMALPASHFYGFISPKLRETIADDRPDDFAKVHTTVKFRENEAETSATVEFLSLAETLHFGFISKHPFPSALEDVTSGWARSEKLSPNFYAPILQNTFEDFQLYGDVDLMASYDGKRIDCALQIDDLLVKHPLIDLKAEKVGKKDQTAGRMKFCFDPKAGYYEGSIPLQGVQAYDRTYGLLFDQLQGDLQINPKKFTGHIAKAHVQFDSIDLCENLSFYFSYDQQFDFQEIRADLPLTSGPTYHLYAPKFNHTSCDLHLYEDKEEIAQLIGENTGDWKGKATFPRLKTTLPATFSWDTLQNKAHFALSGETFSLRVEKDQQVYLVKECKTENCQANAAFTIKEGNAILSSLDLKLPTMQVKGSGTAQVQLPKEQQGLGFFGTLDYELTTQLPIPIDLKGKEPVHWVYSPSMGLALSGVALTSTGIDLSVDHLERGQSGKVSAHKVHFDVAQEWLEKVFAEEALPTLLQDFQMCKGLHGLANIEVEQGAWKIDSNLKSNRGDLTTSLIWDQEGATLSIGDGEKLTLSAHKTDRGLEWDRIQGSFGRLKANLKKTPKKQLKGSVEVDFSLFEELFDLPLNQFVDLWHVRTGYRFDGVFSPEKRLCDWGFKGKIKGSSFECAGYQLRSLEAKVEIEPGQIAIENLDLSDEAGKLWIGEGALMKGSVGQWIFSFPLVEIRGFQPSLLHKLSGPESSISPLVLKSATIRDMRGRIDDPLSISGQGDLRFTNIMKKGQSRLPQNLPLQFLQQAGLDGALFVPTAGELDFALQNGRIYLRGIRNMVSNQNRSEFLPPRNGAMGYLDYHGNFFIDLLVRQRAVRSIPAPLQFTVRGSWHDPQISIK